MLPSQTNILLVEDTAPLALMYQEYMRALSDNVIIAPTGRAAMDSLAVQCPDALILDLLLPDMNGLEILDYAHKLYPNLPIIVVTITNSVDVTVEAMNRGAYDYIVKPLSAPRLLTTLRNALESKTLVHEVREWRQLVGQSQFHGFVGQSPGMQAVYRIIDMVASSKASVFLRGENGTGKELAAEALHRSSPRREKPFIPINCAAIPAELMESTLFGHKKGSFTGAIADHPGAAKMAHGGTLFLDEICDMPIELQTKLLRFTQTGEVMPIGGQRTECVDVRIVSATNRDPVEEIAHRRFREDLYYRLHVVALDIPPLRDRGDDILILASHFLARFNAEENKSFACLSPEVASLFRRYEWPGNVRQLENVIRSIVVLNDAPTIMLNHLPRELEDFAETPPQAAANQNAVHTVTAPSALAAGVKPLWQVEKEAILNALDVTGQDISRAAALLDVSPSTLYRKLQAWRSAV
jgi:two-component system repressor protein LuxO